MEYYESDFVNFPAVTCSPAASAPAEGKSEGRKISFFAVQCLLSALLCLGLLLMGTVFPGVGDWARECLVSDGIGPVEAALEHMVLGVSSGEDFSEAVTVFCREVLDAEAAD